VAGLLGVGTAARKRWRRRRRATGPLAPTRRPGRPPRIAPAAYPALVARVRATPDATLAGRCAAWARAGGARVSPSTVCRRRRRLGPPPEENG
jgi:transposase